MFNIKAFIYGFVFGTCLIIGLYINKIFNNRKVSFDIPERIPFTCMKGQIYKTYDNRIFICADTNLWAEIALK